MSLVIASGLAIGTLFTLFAVPAVYLVVAGEHPDRSAKGRLPIGRRRSGGGSMYRLIACCEATSAVEKDFGCRPDE
jgi:hypothetical protein